MASTGGTNSQGEHRSQIGVTDAGPFHLENNDHLGIAIVTAPFTENNFMTSSIAIQILLGAKDKLGFINDTIEKLKEDNAEFFKWKKANYMVRSWILGSMSKELAETFVYYSTAKNLWDELKERFGEGNRPQIYKLQCEIASIQQGNTNLASYFNKLKRLCDDLSRLKPLPYCECGGCKCGLPKKRFEMDSTTKTIQFLMGLREVFEGVKTKF